jgi:hypothetical protein
VVLALVPPTIEEGSNPDDLALRAGPGAVDVSGAIPARVRDITETLGRQEGVGAVAPLAFLRGAAELSDDGSGVGDYVIADCAQLREVLLGLKFPRCAPDVAYVAGDESTPPWLRPGVVRLPLSDGAVPIRIREVVRMPGSALPPRLSVILPSGAVPPGFRDRVVAHQTLVATDGTATTVERVRNAMAELHVQAGVRTGADARRDATAQARRITSLVDLGIVTALGIALANLLVVTIDHVAERRRPVAVLAASGLPLRMLRRSVAVEIGLPLAVAIALATGTAMAVAGLLGGIIQEPAVFPFGRMATLFALAGGAVAVVTALTFPSLARAARPETLQAE